MALRYSIAQEKFTNSRLMNRRTDGRMKLITNIFILKFQTLKIIICSDGRNSRVKNNNCGFDQETVVEI